MTSVKSEARKKLWESRLADGKCAYCGKNPPRKDTQGCSKCLKKKSEKHKKWSKEKPEKAKAYRSKVRQEVIEKYGGVCKCCGEPRWQFLCLDHVNENGGEERKELYGSQNGSSYRWMLKLRKEEVRTDLQLLCYNCNNAKAVFGVCPHEQETRSPCCLQEGGLYSGKVPV